MSTLSFRLITEGDIPIFQELVHNIYFKHYAHIWDDGGKWYVETMYNTDVVKKEIKDTNSVYLFVNQLNTPIGYLKINITKTCIIRGDIIDNNAMELQRIYLLQSGKGIGKLIMDFACELAKKHAKKILFLQVMSFNKKVFQFYQNCGFEFRDEIQLEYEKIYPQLRGLSTMVKQL